VKSTLPQRLERLFADLGVNQMNFARRTGYEQPYISQILNGIKPSPSERFYKIVSREFNVNPEWIKTGKGKIYTMPGGIGGDETDEVFAKFYLLPKSEQRLIEDMINALLVKSMSDGE
jgi:transcriptional regulator with XRE-family HTH domain